MSKKMGWKTLVFTYFTCAVALGYDLGVINKYSYETITSVDEQCRGEAESHMVGQKLLAKVHLTALWQNPQAPTQQLVRIEVLKPKLKVPKKNSWNSHSSELDKLPTKPSYILREGGSVIQLWEDSNENYALRNIIKGIASQLQLQQKNQNIKEVDVAGSCQTTYELNGKHIQKRKGHCVHSQFDRTLSQPYGVRSATIQHLLSSDCELIDEKSYTLSRCTSSEYVKTYSNVWKTTTLCINAKSKLSYESSEKGKVIYTSDNLDKVIEEIQQTSGAGLTEGSLEAVLVLPEVTSKTKLLDSIKRHQDSLKDENLAKLKSSIAFYKLLPALRTASKEEISKILQNKKFNSIQGQIFDLIAASSHHQEALKAAFEYFQNVKSYDEMLERLLISLSVTPKATESTLKEIKSFLESKKHHEKLEATLVSTLGAVLRTYSQHYGVAKEEVSEEYRNYLEKKLKECSSKSCVTSYLRGLRNAANSMSIPLLMEYALKGEKAALEAVLAIRNVDVRLIPTQVQGALLKVFLQMGSKQDRSTRSVAADILLDMDLETNVLRGLLGALSDQSDPEFSTFLSSKILQKSASNKELRARISKLLSEKFISHYYAFAQKGSSSLFRKPLINSEGLNVTYGIEMEMLPGNLMKRSVFDVDFEQVERSNLLTVGMFAEGIGSLAGGSSEDNATPQAGMELTLLGSSLRPYIFFTGTSELMGHAWSGTASSPTPALQGIFSFSDDEHVVVLHNGLIAHAQLRGVLSADLSASIQISLWSQNSQSQVKNGGALLMRGSVSVDSGFSTMQGAFQFTGQSAIDFSTNLVFSESPFKMCLQMEHPYIVVKQDTHRSLSVTGTNYTLKKTKKRKRNIQSESYALHETNNEQCRHLN